MGYFRQLISILCLALLALYLLNPSTYSQFPATAPVVVFILAPISTLT